MFSIEHCYNLSSLKKQTIFRIWQYLPRETINPTKYHNVESKEKFRYKTILFTVSNGYV